MADFIQGAEDVYEALNRLENHPYEEVAALVKNRYEDEIYADDSIDTGRFIRSVDYHEAGGEPGLSSWTVETSNDPEVTYEGFLETGTKYIPERRTAQHAIEQLGFADTFDAVMSEIFVGAQ